MTRKVRVVLLAVLLVTTAMAGPMTGTVAAQAADTEECGTWDALLFDAFSVGDINLGGDEEENPCSAEYAVAQVNEEWNETDADQTRTAIHSRAGQLSASNEQFFTVSENYLTDSETIAFSEGEAAALEALSNGASVSEAQAAANESIDDYFTVKQRNLIDRWNVGIETVHSIHDRAENTTGVDNDYVTLGTSDNFTGIGTQRDGATYDDTQITESTIEGFGSGTISMVNGSSVTIEQMSTYWDGTYDSSGEISSDLPAQDWRGQDIGGVTARVATRDGYIGVDYSDGDAIGLATQIRVRPSDDLSSTTVLDAREFWKTNQNIEQKAVEVKEEVSTYVEDSLAPAVESGEYNASSYASASTLAREYAADYNGSQSYVQATALAASHGFATPDLDQTAHMTISHDGETFTGLILSQEAPDGGWQADQSYDPAAISGFQMFARSNASANETGMIELDGSFSVKSIQGTGGDQLDKADSVEIVYQQSNASADYSQQQELIRNLTAQIEQRQQSIGGGGDGSDGGSSSGSSNLFVGVILIAGVGLVVIAMREN